MASTDYDWTLTRNLLVRRALTKIGVLGVGETLSAEQLDQGQEILNEIVAEWQNEHVFLWTLTDATLPLVVGASSYQLGDDPLLIAIDRMYLEHPADSNTPLRMVSFRDYLDIPDRTTAGRPTLVAVEYTNPLTLHFWPVPNEVLAVPYIGIVKAKDWQTAAGPGEFPAKWMNALTYALAVELAIEYALPNSQIDRLLGLAALKLKKAKSGDRERDDFTFTRGAFG